MVSLRTPPVLLVLLALAVPATAAAPVRPVPGGYSGEADGGDTTDPVTLRVIRREGELYVKRLRTTRHERCADPMTGQTVADYGEALAVPRMRIRRDGSFRHRSAELGVEGRFGSRRTARGSIDVAPAGLTCTGSQIRFVVRLVPVTCGAERCATPAKSDRQRR